MRWDWTTLRILLATIEEGSIARAANRCAIAGSAAAKRVQDLEASCGMKLFERTARGVRPTQAGEIVARHARVMFDLVRQLDGDIDALSTGGIGSVRLHATASVIAGHRLGEDLATFRSLHPRINLVLREASSLTILTDVLEARADLGIVTVGGELPAGLDGVTWRRDRLALGVAATHRLAARRHVRFVELLDESWVQIVEHGAVSVMLDDAARQLGRALRIAATSASADGARGLVAAGLGVALFPESMLRTMGGAASGVATVALSEPWAARTLRLVSRDPALLTTPAILLRDHLEHPPTTEAASTN